MIYFDVSKLDEPGHQSGLVRVSSRLRAALGAAAEPVKWDPRRRTVVDTRGRSVSFSPQDWWLTVELFSEAERPGLTEFIATKKCRTAAVFHDAIPLRHPHVTWPHSVRRHPAYMKLLAEFDRVWAVSESSRRDLLEFWRWQGVTPRGQVECLTLGADFDGELRSPASARPSRSALLCVGIVEPRKNQEFLLGVAHGLWGAGVDFDLHFVGRVNPHFGARIAKKIAAAARRERRLHFHRAVSDAKLRELYASASAVVFPTLAEGCGLPLLEALWRGVPCVCSDLPVLRENSGGGGCLVAQVNDADDWQRQLRRLLTDDELRARLAEEAAGRKLPTWAKAAEVLRSALSVA